MVDTTSLLPSKVLFKQLNTRYESYYDGYFYEPVLTGGRATKDEVLQVLEEVREIKENDDCLCCFAGFWAIILACILAACILREEGKKRPDIGVIFVVALVTIGPTMQCIFACRRVGKLEKFFENINDRKFRRKGLEWGFERTSPNIELRIIPEYIPLQEHHPSQAGNLIDQGRDLEAQP